MTSARATIQDIYRAAVAAVDPEALVRGAFSSRQGRARINSNGESFPIPETGAYVIAIGKAGPAMASGAAAALGDALRGGIVVAKQAAEVRHAAVEVLEGAHPVPDERSLEAGRRVLEFARKIPAGALAICLISGGGSALVESLPSGVTLDQLRDITSKLLGGGASIHELNAVRSRLSLIKGGGLLGELRQVDIVNLIVSDVLGDDLTVIASGPTVQPQESLSAEDVLEAYGLRVRLPAEVRRPARNPIHTAILANVGTAVEAAARAAEGQGYEPVVLTRRLDGEARVTGRVFAAIATDAGSPRSPLRPGCCVLAGGETTVTLRGDGIGGRNTEAALAAALALQGKSGVTLGFLATDGDDGVSGAAGAIVDDATIPIELRRDARRALERNDSYGFLAGVGAAWSPGATGTNVNDLAIGIIESR
jgi:hydroxypyruvate reductase